MMYYTNTYAGAITLNINNTGAKPVYINGTASSSSNYNLPYGVLLCYYDGTNYYFRTDGVLPGRAKVTTVDDHYTPSANSSYALSVDASSSTAATWGTTNLVTGVNISRDAAGHVTGLTVDSIKMPANPSSNPLKLTVTVSSASSTVAFGQTLSSTDDLQVYQNGLLLTLGVNYSVNSDRTGITLTGYTASVGDIFTFISKSITAVYAAPTASAVTCSSTKLSATNVQGALDELANKTASAVTDYDSNGYDVAVVNSSGQIYKRAKASFLTDFTGITTTTTASAKSIRNIMFKTAAPTSSEGNNGDICIVYTA